MRRLQSRRLIFIYIIRCCFEYKINLKLLKAGHSLPEGLVIMGKLVDLWEENKKGDLYRTDK